MKITPERQAAARAVYENLVHKQGYHPRAAARIVRDAAVRAYRVRRRPAGAASRGMGDASPAADVPASTEAPASPANILKEAADLEPIKAVRDAVSPWLWVTSIGGFVMALINTRRIATMFGDWKRRPRGARA
jgi:hypothetical protein